jgi:integrase
MTSLRAVTEIDQHRAETIELWRNRFTVDTTRRTMWSALVSVTRIVHGLDGDKSIDPATVEWEVFADLIAFEWLHRRLQDSVGPATARKYQSAVTSLLRYLAANGIASANALESTLIAARRRGDSHRSERRSTITTSEIAAVLHVCRTDPQVVTGLRDAALIAVAAGTGARRAEVVRLTRADIDMTTRHVCFSSTKGGEGRTTLLAARAMPDLTAWLTQYQPCHEHPLFPALRKGGLVTAVGLSPHQFWKRVRHRCEQAGVAERATPHDFRRWYVTSLLENGYDIFTVMRTVGHRHPSTTQTYDLRPTERLRDVIDSLAM